MKVQQKCDDDKDRITRTLPQLILERLLPLLILSAAVLVFVHGISLFWSYTVDDSFITFRYARNLISGGGPNFNPGVHAEGCTCALWMVLMTIPHLLHLNVELTAKIVGVASMCLTGALAFLMTRQLISRDDWISRFSAASVPLLLALLYETEANAANAMETSFFVLSVTLSFHLALQLVRKPTRALMASWALSALVTGLTRPDGNIIEAILLVLTAILLPQPSRKRFLGTASLLYLLPGTVYMALRWHYYGLPLPLPFYLKVTGNHNAASAFGGGFAYVGAYLTRILIPVGVLLALALKRLSKMVLPSAVACTAFLVFYLRVDPIMGSDYRFLIPVAPFLFAVSGVGLDVLMRLSPKPGLSCLLGTAYLMAASPALQSGSAEVAAQRQASQAGALAAHTRLGHLLHKLDPSGRSLLAIGDCGMCPYYSGWRTIDIFGLNDPQIALTGCIAPGYVSRQSPDVIVLVSNSKCKPLWDNERTASVYKDCVAAGRYRRTVILCSDIGTHYLWIYARPGTQAHEMLTRLSSETGNGKIGVLK